MRTDPRELLAVGIPGRRSRLGNRIELLLRRGRTFSPRASFASLALSGAVLGGLMLAGSLAPRWIAFAQRPPHLQFEVASVRPSSPGERTTSKTTPGGRAAYTNWALKSLIQVAYGVPGFRVSGGPDWIRTDRFDIVAKAGDAASQDPHKVTNNEVDSYQARMRERLQSLLADRFHLHTHRETRELSGYALVVARNGPKLQEATEEGPGLDEFKHPDGGKGAGIRARGGARDSGGRFLGGGSFKGQMATMAMLADIVTRNLGRPVVDKTGLKGRYDFNVEWAPDPAALGSTPAVPPPDMSGPSAFTAIQEQLGLRLEPARVAVEVLVIDHVERPDAN